MTTKKVINPIDSYTYCHRDLSLDQKFFDHVFIPHDLKSYIHEFCILDEGSNPSDHLPVCFRLDIIVSSGGTVFQPLSGNIDGTKVTHTLYRQHCAKRKPAGI